MVIDENNYLEVNREDKVGISAIFTEQRVEFMREVKNMRCI